MRLNINDSQILWPGKLKRKPEGIIIPTHLKVLTIVETPFIYLRRIGADDQCDPNEEIPCPLFNATGGTGEFKGRVARHPNEQAIVYHDMRFSDFSISTVPTISAILAEILVPWPVSGRPIFSANHPRTEAI